MRDRGQSRLPPGPEIYQGRSEAVAFGVFFVWQSSLISFIYSISFYGVFAGRLLEITAALDSFNKSSKTNIKCQVIYRRYMAEILLIRRKTLSNQSINQSINQSRSITSAPTAFFYRVSLLGPRFFRFRPNDL